MIIPRGDNTEYSKQHLEKSLYFCVEEKKTTFTQQGLFKVLSGVHWEKNERICTRMHTSRYDLSQKQK